MPPDVRSEAMPGTAAVGGADQGLWAHASRSAPTGWGSGGGGAGDLQKPGDRCQAGRGSGGGGAGDLQKPGDRCQAGRGSGGGGAGDLQKPGDRCQAAEDCRAPGLCIVALVLGLELGTSWSGVRRYGR